MIILINLIKFTEKTNKVNHKITCKNNIGMFLCSQIWTKWAPFKPSLYSIGPQLARIPTTSLQEDNNHYDHLKSFVNAKLWKRHKIKLIGVNR